MSVDLAKPWSRAGIWPTKVKVQCRNEQVFEAFITFRQMAKGLVPVPKITCPWCARDYYLNEDGFWMSDRPLKIIGVPS